MIRSLFLFFAGILGALFSAMVPVRADRNPDFYDDAKPILRMQPGLLRYVQQNFEVRDTGLARIPGDEARKPMPPFIFQARPKGTSGAYFITLLIQPGPIGRILKVVDSSRPHGPPPGMAQPRMQPPPGYPGSEDNSPPDQGGPDQQQPSEPQTPSQNQPPDSKSPPASNSDEPTSATPSGPITSDNDSSAKLPPPPNQAPSLAPPPDAAPSQ